MIRRNCWLKHYDRPAPCRRSRSCEYLPRARDGLFCFVAVCFGHWSETVFGSGEFRTLGIVHSGSCPRWGATVSASQISNRSFHVAAQFVGAAKPVGVRLNPTWGSRTWSKERSTVAHETWSCVATVEDFVDSAGSTCLSAHRGTPWLPVRRESHRPRGRRGELRT